MNIVITGASRGIGFELAKSMAEEHDHKVFVISRNTASIESLAKEINKYNADRLFYLGFDLLTDNYAETLIPAIRDKLGHVDVLINNAGTLVNKPIQNLSNEDFDLLFNLNIKSPFRLIREMLPLFNKPAHIVNITSMGGVQGSAKFPGLSLYSASKGALGIFTECIAEEFKGHDIKANALAIGAVQTEMLSEAFPGYKAPLQPKEMAAFIKNFALTGHQYFNGKILPVSLSTP